MLLYGIPFKNELITIARRTVNQTPKCQACNWAEPAWVWPSLDCH